MSLVLHSIAPLVQKQQHGQLGEAEVEHGAKVYFLQFQLPEFGKTSLTSRQRCIHPVEGPAGEPTKGPMDGPTDQLTE